MAKGFLELDALIAILVLISIAAMLFAVSITSFGDLKEKTSTSSKLIEKLIEDCEENLTQNGEGCIDFIT